MNVSIALLCFKWLQCVVLHDVSEIICFSKGRFVAEINQDPSLWQTVCGLGYLLESANAIALGYICSGAGQKQCLEICQELHDFAFVSDE